MKAARGRRSRLEKSVSHLDSLRFRNNERRERFMLPWRANNYKHSAYDPSDLRMFLLCLFLLWACGAVRSTGVSVAPYFEKK